MKLHLQGDLELGSRHIVIPLHWEESAYTLSDGPHGGLLPNRGELSAAITQVTAAACDGSRRHLLGESLVFMMYDGYCHSGDLVCVADVDGEREPGTPVVRWWLEAEDPHDAKYMERHFHDGPGAPLDPERPRSALGIAFDAWWAREGEEVYQSAMTDENGENLTLHLQTMGHCGFDAGFRAALSLSKR